MRLAVAGATGTVGRYIVEVARGAGHEPVALSRTEGVDLRDRTQVERALEGVEAIVDAANAATTSEAAASAFFAEVTDNLHMAGAAWGVRHLVTLSIVGIDRVTGYGYYRAKLVQEQAVRAGPLPATIVRATQFHEFPAQILARTRRGPTAVMPRMRVQPIAARTVAEILVETATGMPLPEIQEVAGPEIHDLTAMARQTAASRGTRLLILPIPVPGEAARAMRTGALLPGPGARIAGPAFAEWLTTEDAGSPTF